MDDKGSRLIALRKKLGKSQVEAARFLGLSKQTLYKYEKNIITNIPSDVVERMASYYKTTPAYIMGWEDEAGNKTAHGQLVDAYVVSRKNKEILDLYNSAPLAVQVTVENYLKASKQILDLPH